MSLIFLLSVPLIATLLMFLWGKKTRTVELIAMSAGIIELLLAISVAFVDNGAMYFAPYLKFDALGQLFLVIVALLGCMSLLYSVSYLKKEAEKQDISPERFRNYYALFQLFLLSMFVAAGSNNILLLWIAVEATTLTSAFLINFFDRPQAIEAAWKYMIINTVALLLGLFGVYIFIGTVSEGALAQGLLTGTPFDWSGILALAPALDSTLLKLAFVFILIGYGTKAGLAPLHNWLPDAHSQAPVPVSAMLSGALLNIALLALLRFKNIVDASVGAEFTQTIFLFFGTISIILAAIMMLTQKQYKRLLAYSSVEHMGIIIFGLGLGGVAGVAALLHAFYHSVAKASLFLASGNIALRYHTLEIGGVRGLLHVLPTTGVLFFGGLLAVGGLPPFGTFLTEFSIFAQGFQSHPWLTSIITFALVLAFAGIARHFSVMLFGKEPQGQAEPIQSGEFGLMSYLPIALLFALLVSFSVSVPEPLMLLITEAAL